MSYLHRIKNLKQQGYLFRIIYLWIPKVEIAIKRVKQRIKKGGHAVPEKDIRRRFNSSLNHFFRFYLPLVDEALLCDAEAKPILIAHFKQNQWDILNKKTYDLVQKQITS